MSGGEVTCMRCGATVVPADRFCESCGTVLSAVRRVAVPGPPESQEDSAAASTAATATYVDEYCTVCGQPARRARSRPGATSTASCSSPTAVSNTRATRTPPQRESSPAVRAKRSPSPCATGCRLLSAADTAAKSASTAGVDAMLNALAATRKPQSAVLAGLTDAANAAAAAGADSLGSGHCAVVHLRGGGRRSDLDGHNRDHRRQRGGQQGLLASRTSRARAMPHGRRLRLRRN